jgi:hypothetical protein
LRKSWWRLHSLRVKIKNISAYRVMWVINSFLKLHFRLFLLDMILILKQIFWFFKFMNTYLLFLNYLIFLVGSHHRFDQVINLIDVLFGLWVAVLHLDVGSSWVWHIGYMNFFKVIVGCEFIFANRFWAKQRDNVVLIAIVARARLKFVFVSWRLIAFNKSFSH